MDHNFSAEYVPSPLTTQTVYHPMDGLQTVKASEALLVHHDNRGFELIKTQSIISNANKMVHMAVIEGLIVIFKNKKV